MQPTIKTDLVQLAKPAGAAVSRAVSEVRTALNIEATHQLYTQTSSATARVIWSEAMAPNRLWLVRYSVLARATDGAVAGYERMIRYDRGASGAATARSTDTIGTDYETHAAWDITPASAADGTISLSVTGDATHTINWVATVRVTEIS